jgi:pyruvate formate lyase activating enzyme
LDSAPGGFYASGMKSARFWHEAGGGRVQCDLCPHRCLVGEGKNGRCRVRGVRAGQFVALGYGRVSSAHLDPIEKKPLYHFHPGRSIFSVGGWGCNFACAFCQNWTISQEAQLDSEACEPEDVAARAAAGGSVGIAYTYNEPLVGFEFVLDCARLVRRAGAANVLVTNGFVQSEPAAELLPLIDALNVDIKSIEESFYREHCRGSLAPVLAFCKQAMAAGCHVEVTNLLIPGLNESDDQVGRLAAWVAANLGPATPLHLSAYHPEHTMTAPPTPVEVLERAHALCKRELSYVYLGNAVTEVGRDTLCPGCGAVLVSRLGYRTRIEALDRGACRTCGRNADMRT